MNPIQVETEISVPFSLVEDAIEAAVLRTRKEYEPIASSNIVDSVEWDSGDENVHAEDELLTAINVTPLEHLPRQRVDGITRNPERVWDEENAYGAEWIEEQEHRIALLCANTLYQFLILVAGLVHTKTDKLWNGPVPTNVAFVPHLFDNYYHNAHYNDEPPNFTHTKIYKTKPPAASSSSTQFIGVDEGEKPITKRQRVPTNARRKDEMLLFLLQEGDLKDFAALEAIKILYGERSTLSTDLLNAKRLRWAQLPENLGRIYLEPVMVASIEYALQDVRLESRNSSVSAIELMTHEPVKMTFAVLVSKHVLLARYNGPAGYNIRITQGNDYKVARQTVKALFKTLHYNSEGRLQLSSNAQLTTSTSTSRSTQVSRLNGMDELLR